MWQNHQTAIITNYYTLLWQSMLILTCKFLFLCSFHDRTALTFFFFTRHAPHFTTQRYELWVISFTKSASMLTYRKGALRAHSLTHWLDDLTIDQPSRTHGHTVNAPLSQWVPKGADWNWAKVLRNWRGQCMIYRCSGGLQHSSRLRCNLEVWINTNSQSSPDPLHQVRSAGSSWRSFEPHLLSHTPARAQGE